MTALLVIAALLAIPAAAGWLMAVIDPPPPRVTLGATPRPRRAFPGLDTEGNRGNLEAAPHRVHLVAWGGSIFGGRR